MVKQSYVMKGKAMSNLTPKQFKETFEKLFDFNTSAFGDFIGDDIKQFFNNPFFDLTIVPVKQINPNIESRDCGTIDTEYNKRNIIRPKDILAFFKTVEDDLSNLLTPAIDNKKAMEYLNTQIKDILDNGQLLVNYTRKSEDSNNAEGGTLYINVSKDNSYDECGEIVPSSVVDHLKRSMGNILNYIELYSPSDKRDIIIHVIKKRFSSYFDQVQSLYYDIKQSTKK